MENDDCINDYSLEKFIGYEEDTSEVFISIKKETKEKYKIRRLKKESLKNKYFKKYINNEIFLLRNICHKNIIKFFDCKTGKNYIYIIEEFCNGGTLKHCLDDYIEKYNKPFSLKIVQHLMKEIISGLNYLHKNHIIHRNIKIDNIEIIFPSEEAKEKIDLLKCEIRIKDFFFSKYLKEDNLAKSILGTPMNMDPHILKELIKDKNRDKNFSYDEKVDIWSLGTLAYELFIGSSIFDSNDIFQLYRTVEKGIYIIPYEVNLSKEAFSFLKGMLQYDPKKRLSAEQLSTHYFITKNADNFKLINFFRIKVDIYSSCFDNYLLIPYNEKYFAKLADLNPYDYLDDNENIKGKEDSIKFEKKVDDSKDLKNDNDEDNLNNDLQKDEIELKEREKSLEKNPIKEKKIPLIDDLLEF